MLVRFSDNCATPYSSMYQPIPFTDFNVPGMRFGSPFSSSTGFPPSFKTRPASRISNAIALARRVEVVFKFTLYATKKSRAPMVVIPDLRTLSVTSFGPKSGVHSEVEIFSIASYSPFLQFAKFARTSCFAADS